MAKNSAGQDEFVDLYEVLDVPENADSETIRKRVNALYIEAQQNLDHRNVKKRLQFQQMYEIYLPQARHLLLDTVRRGEYDRYLNAFRTGSKVEAVADASAPIHSTRSEVIEGELGGAPDREAGGLPELIEAVDPAQLAAEREAMWAKWKTGLEIVSEDAPDKPAISTDLASGTQNFQVEATDASAAARPAPGTSPANRARPSPVVPRFQPPAPGGARPAPRPAAPRPSPGAPAAPGSSMQPSGSPTRRPPGASTPSPQAASSARGDASPGAYEKQREQQRYMLIKTSVQNAGLMWGAGTAAAAFLLGCVILFVIDNALKPPYPLGLPHGAFTGLCFLIVVLLSILAGFTARKRAKRHAVAELSVLSLEELMRRSG